MVSSPLVSAIPINASAPPEQKVLTICTSLKTGFQMISKTGKCNERLYESRTWFQKGTAPSGTPGSEFLDLKTCISKSSNLQMIRMGSACNSKTQITSLWQRPLGPPVAPTITSVAMGILGTATLELSAPKEDGGARVTSYLVTSAPGEFKATYKPDQIKAAKFSGLIPGNTYSFTVVAINSKGSSPASISSKPTIAPTIPSAPTITKVVATGTNTAQITFTAPINDGGSPITSYVARSNPGGLQTTVYQSASGTINISNLAHSTTYTFILVANNAAGASPESVNSASITTATPPPPPAPVVAEPTPTPTSTAIAVAAIAGVTVPVTGATPVTTTTAGTGYTGTVSWLSGGGAPLLGNFAGANFYTATITLTPTAGYTLTGVAANFFTVAGATRVTHLANSGVITAEFPRTLGYCDGSTFTCRVGDTGPGGGTIFYVAATTFTQESATGSMCSVNCKYLEAAPSGWSNNGVAANDSARTWSANLNQVPGANGTGIGSGYKNSEAIKAVTADSAAGTARAYSGGDKSDWYLPARDELNQMCKWVKGQAWVSDATLCNESGNINVGTGAAGFVANYYWGSSELTGGASYASFSTGDQGPSNRGNSFRVRPIRAFGVSITISVAAIAGVTVPVAGETPVTTTTAGTGYTGTVSWSGALTDGKFPAATTYTATITLTPTAGYTLTGVVANFFKVAGALVSHSANSGVITAVFYKVGATGPGGGTIFYVATTPFACGPNGILMCTYLEAAPSGWNTGSDPTRTWAQSTPVNYQGTTVSPETATATAIGWGFRNTVAIVLQGNSDAATSAAALVRSYRPEVSGRGFSDWHLPSKDELNQMCKWIRGQTWVSDATECNGTGGVNTGVGATGFEDSKEYWSSTELGAGNAAGNFFANGLSTILSKSLALYVRPVRTF
jgi:hypothetical protein